MTARIVIGGAPHSGKSVAMSLIRDALCARGVSVELLDLDKASPTVCRLTPGKESEFAKKEWCKTLVEEAKTEMKKCRSDVCLGDAVGLVSNVSKEIAESADSTIVLSRNGSEIKKWKQHYQEVGKPILATVASKQACPTTGDKWDPRTKTGIVCGLDREEYKSGKLYPGPAVVGVAKEIEEHHKLRARPGVLCSGFRKILQE